MYGADNGIWTRAHCLEGSDAAITPHPHERLSLVKHHWHTGEPTVPLWFLVYPSELWLGLLPSFARVSWLRLSPVGLLLGQQFNDNYRYYIRMISKIQFSGKKINPTHGVCWLFYWIWFSSVWNVWYRSMNLSVKLTIPYNWNGLYWLSPSKVTNSSCRER